MSITKGVSETIALGKGPGGEEIDAKVATGWVIVIIERGYAKGGVLRLRVTPGEDGRRGCVAMAKGHVETMEKAKLAVLRFKVHSGRNVEV